MTTTDKATEDAAPVSAAAIKAALSEALGEKSKALRILDGLDAAAIAAEIGKLETRITALQNALFTLRGLAKMANRLTHGKAKRAAPGSNKKKAAAANSGDDYRGDVKPAPTAADKIATHLRAAGPSSPAAIAVGVRLSSMYVKAVLGQNPDRFNNVSFGIWELKR